MPEGLSHVLDDAVVSRLASSRSYERGVAYLEEGRVGVLRLSADRVSATVQGSEPYEVELRVVDRGLRFSCTCPIGVEGAFCKHCVAVASSWLRSRNGVTPTLEDAQAHLKGLPADELVEMLIDHAHEDERLARKLLLFVARPADGAAADLSSLRALIDQAFAYGGGFVPYREAWSYVSGIEDAIGVLDDLLARGRAKDVVQLAEHALRAAEAALDHVDDSDGLMRGVIERLEEQHLEACRVGQLDRLALAQRLFEWEMNGDWDVFDQAAVRYGEVLGDDGLAHYRKLAGETWAAVPELRPGDDSGRSYHGTRFRITRIMHGLVERYGNLDDQISVAQRDLAGGYQFLQIAELCRAHEEHDMALDWAQRGIAAFPDRPDPRLRSFLVEEYRRRNRFDQSLEHTVQAFSAHPSLERYKDLAIDAKKLGEWDRRRTWALELLAPDGPGGSSAAIYSSLRGRDCTELVKVLLWEGDPDGAWEAACDRGCTSDLWLELADLRRGEHPGDALEVYNRHVERVIDGKDKRSYAEAARLIDTTVRALYEESGRGAEFAGYLDDLRKRHKPKRNLMKAMAHL